MRTIIDKIDFKPKCLVCGQSAKYNFARRGLFYNYSSTLCFNCLRKKCESLRILVFREAFSQKIPIKRLLYNTKQNRRLKNGGNK